MEVVEVVEMVEVVEVVEMVEKHSTTIHSEHLLPATRIKTTR